MEPIEGTFMAGQFREPGNGPGTLRSETLQRISSNAEGKFRSFRRRTRVARHASFETWFLGSLGRS